MSPTPEPLAARLGCYVVPGAAPDPRRALDEAAEAERLGLAAVWIGERYDSKDLPSLAGAISQVTERVRIGAAVTHPGLRHPMVLASMGQTLQALTGGRFALGLGRSASWRWDAYGVTAPTLRSLEDVAVILRRLWAGETVDYDGPLGHFPRLKLAQLLDVSPPALLLASIGPKGLALAGRAYDGVILHPMLSVEGVRRSVAQVREHAARVGRDPSAVRCVAAVVVAPDLTSERTSLAVNARAAGYLSVPGLGDALARANGWSEVDLAAYRDQPLLTTLGGLPADKHLTGEQLVGLSDAMPSHWLPEAAATGTGAQCARRLQEYAAAGADEIIVHGSTAGELAAVVAACEEVGL